MFLVASHAFIAALALSIISARAALYPTKPTASTWYSVNVRDRGLNVQWRDTESEPHAYDLGQLQVQLLNAEGFVTELWPLIDSWSHTATVYVPKRVALATGSEYFIRFVPGDEVWRAVYTASFTVVNSTAPPVSDEAILSAKNMLNETTSSDTSVSSDHVTGTATSASGGTLGRSLSATRTPGAASAVGTAGAADGVATSHNTLSIAALTTWPVVAGLLLAM